MWLERCEYILQCFLHYFERKTRCVCETQMPPKMTNSKDGQGHMVKYLDTSRKILSQEMLMCNIKALIFILKKMKPQ